MTLHTKEQREALEAISLALGNLIAQHESGQPVFLKMARDIEAAGPIPTVEEKAKTAGSDQGESA
jgi:hypothetical protein